MNETRNGYNRAASTNDELEPVANERTSVLLYLFKETPQRACGVSLSLSLSGEDHIPVRFWLPKNTLK